MRTRECLKLARLFTRLEPPVRHLDKRSDDCTRIGCHIAFEKNTCTRQ